MKADDYLRKILDSQTFDDGDPELETLRERIAAVKSVLRREFAGSNPSIRQAGSLAKDTMVKESYDGDVTCYFPHEETDPGDSLEATYASVQSVLQVDYYVSPKPSALRIKDKSPETYATDFHIDVVPGRFVDDDKRDVHLHQNSTEKSYLKTNLQVHIDHVRKSEVRSAIRLAKLWNIRNGVGTKTFVLELLVIKILEQKKTSPLSEQIVHFWTELRDHPSELAVEDPANPGGNDLKAVMDECRWNLSAVAGSTLAQIEAGGWESVFGPVVDDDDDDEGGGGNQQTAALKSSAAALPRRTKPWAG
jgi:hypothetical protein